MLAQSMAGDHGSRSSKLSMAIADWHSVFFPMCRSSLLSYFFSESFALWDRRMSDRFHLKDGIATPVLTVIVALVFVGLVF